MGAALVRHATRTTPAVITDALDVPEHGVGERGGGNGTRTAETDARTCSCRRWLHLCTGGWRPNPARDKSQFQKKKASARAMHRFGGCCESHIVVHSIPFGVMNCFRNDVRHFFRAKAQLHQRLLQAHSPYKLSNKIQLARACLHFGQPRHHARFPEGIDLQLRLRLSGFRDGDGRGRLGRRGRCS